jgi:AcrR family transcriptional regulator
MTEPPYQRIAADLRRRIAAGELRPGDRVPSTRQLTIRWGVALATATKALTVLRQEGLVRAVPRVGTVVAEPAPISKPVAVPKPAAAGPERDLSHDRIIRVAIEIADAEGLEALSMRGIAARVGAATMSTYRHVTSKDDLVLQMADAAFGELPPAAHDDGAGWRERVEATVRTMWAVHRRHPWLAHLSPLTRPLPLPRLLGHGEQVLAAFADAGLDAVTTLNLQILLYSYVQGLAINIEREAHAAATTGVSDDEWMRQQGPAMGAITATGRYPAFARLMETFTVRGYDLDLDLIFELGLGLMLDGLTPLVTNGARTGPG